MFVCKEPIFHHRILLIIIRLLFSSNCVKNLRSEFIPVILDQLLQLKSYIRFELSSLGAKRRPAEGRKLVDIYMEVKHIVK